MQWNKNLYLLSQTVVLVLHLVSTNLDTVYIILLSDTSLLKTIENV